MFAHTSILLHRYIVALLRYISQYWIKRVTFLLTFNSGRCQYFCV